jgi:L-amino acid N-acyltransferase YncA
MTAHTVRPATSADISAITRIYGASVLTGTASFELEPPDEPEMARRMAELTGKGFPYLAAEANGDLAGYAYAALYRTRPAYRFTVEDSVYIAAEHRRGGVGRALLSALIEACTQRGFRQMIAVIGDSPQQPGSVALHTALGFSHVGILPNVGFKHGHWCDSLLMQRALGPGGTEKP